MTYPIRSHIIPIEAPAPVRNNKRTLNQISTDLSLLTELVSDLLQNQADSDREIADLHEKNKSLKKKIRTLIKPTTVQTTIISSLQSETLKGK